MAGVHAAARVLADHCRWCQHTVQQIQQLIVARRLLNKTSAELK
jgi:hypothetical protein